MYFRKYFDMGMTINIDKTKIMIIKSKKDTYANFGHENNCRSANLVMWDKKKFMFETLVIPVILYGCEVWGCNISRES